MIAGPCSEPLSIPGSPWKGLGHDLKPTFPDSMTAATEATESSARHTAPALATKPDPPRFWLSHQLALLKIEDILDTENDRSPDLPVGT